MNKIKHVDGNFFVSPQLSTEDLGEVAKSGIKTIINNRPDGEGRKQPPNSEIEQAVKDHGLDYFYLPVVPDKITETEISVFGKTLSQCKSPVLAFCRTGTRSISLWALSEVNETFNPDELIAMAAKAGYDIQFLKKRLQS